MAKKDNQGSFTPIVLDIQGGDEESRKYIADTVVKALRGENLPVVPPAGLTVWQNQKNNESRARTRDRFSDEGYRSLGEVIRQARPELFETALIVREFE